jgi:adrenodoxin-NADP+ reductase
MKVCVVGGGPAGMHSASYLLSRNVDVTLYEKDGELGGNYRYALLPEARFSPFQEMLKNPRLVVRLNTAVDQSKLKSMEKEFDGFVIATGSQSRRRLKIPGFHNCIDGLEVVKSYHGLRDAFALGKKVLIVGMGNVALDICKYLFGWADAHFKFSEKALESRKDVKDVTLTSRSGMYSSAFTNAELRSLLETPNIGLRWEEGRNEPQKTGSEGWWTRRKKLFELGKHGDRGLRLLFNTNVLSIDRAGGRYVARFMRDGGMHEEAFDSVISSIGFETPGQKFASSKPLFYVGWARKPRGDVNEARADAYDAVAKMVEVLRKRVPGRET